MATASPASCVAHIGKVAGTIWQALSEKGPLSTAKLVKAVDEPRDTVMQALGWLAREGKVDIDDDGRNRMVSLQQP
jgi:DNA-binding transcriptional ArsR family regulator